MQYYPSPLCTLPLPYKHQGKVYTTEVRQGGKLSMLSSTLVPYGLYGRLALIAITSLAYKSDSKTLTSSYESLYTLLKQLKSDKPTGTQLEKFETQMTAWANTYINISHISNTQKEYHNLLLIETAHFQLKKDSLIQDESTKLKFTAAGKDFLTTNSIPVPSEIIRDISQPFLFDIFTWAVVSTFSNRNKDRQYIPWTRLYAQFRIPPNKTYDFREKFHAGLRSVIYSYYPTANIIVDKTKSGGVYLEEILPLVPSKENVMLPVFKEEGEQKHD